VVSNEVEVILKKIINWVGNWDIVRCFSGGTDMNYEICSPGFLKMKDKLQTTI